MISSSGGQIIAVQNPALALSDSLSLKTPIQSKSEASSPSNKSKKDESTTNVAGAVSKTLLNERQITRSATFSTANFKKYHLIYDVYCVFLLCVFFVYSRSIGNRVSTSSDVDKARLSNKTNSGGETGANDTTSDDPGLT